MEYNDGIRNRLRRIEGQVRGVLNMMDEERSCPDVITQLSAIRKAVDRAMATVVAENLERCIRADVESGSDTREAIQEAIELLVKSK
ncbi:metal-sensitive transcriptional regulator [Alicyclobacillus tolerans]|uniref:metal-sensitive transcriptional regulator n=1 Tax=Alicyclobacillus tolerans TaxID=90970 RepID=UPI001F1580A6|nr:metal-sensitive transcriptional regulator [Alicyclobacillus tolerans]MCF8568265.1 metal-sensitive transcriptional regulator [Alicyclobacillus tolerans]